MRSFSLALASVFALGCGTPCSDAKLAGAVLAPGLGSIIALAFQCPGPDEAPPKPIAADQGSGLAAQQPDLADAPPDMGQASDLGELHCGQGSVRDSYNGVTFCSPDADLDGVPDRQDQCKALAAGQTPDPTRRGCPSPREYEITIPAAAFAAAGSLTFADGIATSKAHYDWSTMTRSVATLTTVIFFQNGGPNASNEVDFELQGQADFTAPPSTVSTCAAFKDNAHQDAGNPNPITGNPLDVACIARRLAICPVDLLHQKAVEADCAQNVTRGGGYWSAANAPIKLTANVSAGDFYSSDPQPVAGIEVQILMSGNVVLSGWNVVAHVKETLH